MKKLVYILLFVSVGILAQTQTENYVMSTTYKVKTLDGVSKVIGGTIAPEEKQVSISYFDGLGRAKQSVVIATGGNKEDIITHFKYDAFGRQTKEFLPFANGSYNLDIRSENLENLTSLENYTNNFYKNKFPDDFLNVALQDVNAYSEKHFENSPLNRVLEQGAPGKDWKVNKSSDSDYTIKFHYGTNSSNEVLLFEVVFENGNTQTPKLKLPDSYYNAGELYKTITKDENWRTYDGKDKTTEEFKNKQGQVVLKRTYNNQQAHDTHYVYDDFGNLTYVIPPLASEKAIIYEPSTINIPVSNLAIGGNPTGNISIGIVKTGVNTYQFVGDINLHNLGNSTFIDGVIMDIPNLPASLGSYVFLGGIYQYDYIDDIEYERVVNYYISNGKLYCSSYSYSYNYNTDEYGDDVSEAGFPDITEIDEAKTIGLANTLEGITEAETQVQVNAILEKLGYQYKYDSRNRLVEKKIPGKGWEYIIYDPLDRPILTQDANLRSSNKWLFTKYDVFGRVAYTGIYTHNTLLTQQQMQSHYNNASAQGGGVKLYYESKSTLGFDSSYVQHYYTNYMFPFSNIEILTVNYYDDYVFNRLGMGESISTYNGTNSTSNVKGLVTGTKIKVLDESPEKWITTINYYDHKARPIYVYSKNEFLGSTDFVESKLDDFTGKVLQTKTTHSKVGVANPIFIFDTFEYDHADRLITHKQTINWQSEELISKNYYDNLGQLVKKDVGKSEALPLQEVDYTYNIRGWLRKINEPENGLGSDVFSLQLLYNDPGGNLSNTKLYNGNISQSIWRTGNDNVSRNYNYSYDDLNRITAASYYSFDQYSRFNLSGINYDKNGNIQRLTRRGAIVENPIVSNASHYNTMDNLTYTYNGNQLTKVDDIGNKTYGFKDITNTIDYAYDANGNMIQDLNKGIIGLSNTAGILYNHLNLPTEVKFGGTNKIKFTYDATGVKLRKQIIENGKPDKFTYYAGNYIYEGSSLQFFSHPEGYVKIDNGVYNYVYQYKDHLGNVRLSYVENPTPDIPVTVFSDNATNTQGWNSIGALYGGSAIVATDKSYSEGKSFKIQGTVFGSSFAHSNVWIPINNSVPTKYTFSGRVFLESAGYVYGKVTLFMNEDTETGYFTQVEGGDAIKTKGQWVYFERTVTVPANIDKINLRIELYQQSNNATAWFDDLKLVKGDLSRTTIIEESNYYPFGLKHKGYNNVTSSNGNSVAQKFGYNGKELNESLGLNIIEMDMRMYDPALGRFNGIDPITHYSMGTSVAFDNNPIFWADPIGADAMPGWLQSLWDNSGSGYTQYTNTGNRTFEQTAHASDEDIKNGKAILIAFPDQNPKIPSNQKVAKWYEKTFSDGDGKFNVGHAGIVLVDGDTGGTQYFDFGRYKRPDLGELPEDIGAVRSSKNFSGLSIPDWNFNKTNEENVSTIVTALHNSPVFKGYGTIMGTLAEGLDFKAMLKYATEMEKNGYHAFGGYKSSTNSSNPTYCAKFARGVAEAGGFDWSWYVLTGKANVEDVNRVNKNGIKTIKD